MNRIKRVLLGMMVGALLALQPSLATATQMDDETFLVQPSEMAIIGDVLIARPASIVATVAGLGLFLVTMPFTVLGGNGEATAETLVGAPFRSAFIRCLGCTPEQSRSVRSLR